MSRTFVMGDIHGAHRALVQCLTRANFDYENDRLIALGDVADGWPDTRKCIDEMLKMKNLVYILGNHDHWALQWMEYGIIDDVWYSQGGKSTIESYNASPISTHIDFLKRARLYYKEHNNVFVHAGLDPLVPLEQQTFETLLWDRTLARTAMQRSQAGTALNLTPFDSVFLGHTPVGGRKPLKACEVWLMDTAAGWAGVLSMMDIATLEVFTSDAVPELYPGIEGRKKKNA